MRDHLESFTVRHRLAGSGARHRTNAWTTRNHGSWNAGSPPARSYLFRLSSYGSVTETDLHLA